MYWDGRRLVVVAVLCGCGPVVLAPEDESTSTGAPTPTTTQGDEQSSVAEEVTTDEPMPPPMTTTSTTTSVDDTGTTTVDSDPTGGSFIPGAPDGGNVTIECDLWTQDCPRGEKCMPWANDGGGAWNATRCSPLDPNPADIGEECMVEGSGVSGIDNCGLAAMCWDVDPETNMGECVAFCEGNEANPTCADECSSCALSGDGVLILCLENCDPLAQNCGDDDGCYPTNGDVFACVVDVSGDAGGIGSECEFLNVCDPGNACITPDVVPGCAGAGCCSPFCSLAEEDPCEALLPGTVCTPWWELGQAPEPACVDYEVIGVCAAP